MKKEGRTHYQHPLRCDGLGWCYASAPTIDVTSDEGLVTCRSCRRKLVRRDRRNGRLVARINKCVLAPHRLAGGVFPDLDRGGWGWEIWTQSDIGVVAVDKFLPSRQDAVTALAQAALDITSRGVH